ncbi:MAG: DUF927 domain-containing protein [Leptospirillum sp.]
MFGPSSSGKTTALRVAASVYGHLEYIRQWLKADNKGKSSLSVTMPNLGKKRVYVFYSEVFEEPEKKSEVDDPRNRLPDVIRTRCSRTKNRRTGATSQNIRLGTANK